MRRIDVLTLGLSAPSRWNPLYRRWARIQTERNLTAALKALTARYGVEQDDAGTYALVLDREELAFAQRYVGTLANGGGGALRVRVERGIPPRRLRMLWGRYS